MKALGALLLVLVVAGCPNKSINESKTLLADGNKAHGAKQYDTAITSYQKAVEKWGDNHLAYYGMGGSYAGRGEWEKAADSFSNSVRLSPGDAMYQMWYGVALYEKAIKSARDDQARKENKKPEEIQVDMSTINFEKSLQHLTEAVKLNKDMWRAHYYLGRIYRAQDKAKEAASEFSAALQANPREQGPYVALAELYRKWDYTDEAIKVASQGSANVPGTNEVSDILYVLGMAYDDKNMHDKAIEAFDKSIESKRDNHKAKFQRGQAYFKKGDMTKAKRDLEEFSKSGGASLEFAKQQASKMLMDIAAKSMEGMTPPPGGAPPTGSTTPSGAKLSPEDLVKQKKK